MEYLLNNISSVEDEDALEKVEIEETNNLRSIKDGVLCKITKYIYYIYAI